jgi:hypothetical protein
MFNDRTPTRSSEEQRADTLGMLESRPYPAVREAIQARQKFIEKYQIQLVPESSTQVRYVLPVGTSRLDFVLEAQKIAKSIDPCAPIIQEARIDTICSKAPAMRAPLPVNTPFAVDCMVENSGGKTFEEQRSFLQQKGLRMAVFHDLLTASVAFSVASDRRDPFVDGLHSCTVGGETDKTGARLPGQESAPLLGSPGGLTDRCFFMLDSQASPALRVGAYLPAKSS